MNTNLRNRLRAVAVLTLGATVMTTQAAAPAYAVLDRIAGPDGGGWDYTTIDATKRRLYMARDAGILSMDLDSRQIVPVAIAGAGTHTAAIVGDTGLVLVTNGNQNNVSVFDTKTQKSLGTVAVGERPDAAIYDPNTKLVAVMNHRGGTVSLIDPAQLKLVRTIAVGGVLEFAAAAGDGRLFLNIENQHTVAVLDLNAGTVLKRWVLSGCEEPSGLVYDAEDALVASVCGNGVTKFLHAADGTEAASLNTGNGADGLILDAARKRLFVPAGEDGTLAVVALGAAPSIVQMVTTAKGARLGAVDPKSGRIYLPSATMGPPVPPQPWPSIVKGSFAFLVVGAR